MKTDHSFSPLLHKYAAIVKPTKILEWGPGKSTGMLLEACPSASVTSVEHDLNYFGLAELAYPLAKIIYAPILNYGPSEYSCWPLLHAPKEKYDLIFIDGRQRVSCLVTALNVLNDGGVVILHDAERPHYQHGIQLFKVIDSTGCTVALQKK